MDHADVLVAISGSGAAVLGIVVALVYGSRRRGLKGRHRRAAGQGQDRSARNLQNRQVPNGLNPTNTHIRRTNHPD
jgi:hypothetical protein